MSQPPWQPPQYDPVAHQQRLQGGQPHAPGSQQWSAQPPPAGQYPPPGYGYQPPQPHRRRRPRAPLYAGIAAVIVIAGGGAAYALTGSSGPAKPLTYKQQYAAWKTGPARDLATRTIGPDGKTLQSAANSEDIPATLSALKTIGNDATALQQYPMPACADPAGYWTRMLGDMKAAGDNAGSASGLAALMAAMAPMQQAQPLAAKLSAELKQTTGS